MDTIFDPNDKKQIVKYAMILMIILGVFLGVKTLGALKEYSFIGKNIPPMNVISVTGTAEVYAKPDVASFNYSVVEEAKTANEAQDKATTKTNAVLDALKKAGIADKDVKTIAYNIYPKYEYQTSQKVGGLCVNGYCSDGKQVIVGYEVSQTVEVKVRKVDTAGDMLALVGGMNVSNVSNLNFVVDDMDALKAEVRNKAIVDAKEKAKALSKVLGVSFDSIINFSEAGDGYYPVAMSARYDAGMMETKAVAPQLPTGENKITSQVTLTYSLK